MFLSHLSSYFNRKQTAWHLFSLAIFFIPLSQQLNKIFLFLSLLFVFLQENPFNILKRLYRNAWDILLYIATLLISMIYTQNTNVGWDILKSYVVFLTVPLIIGGLGKLTQKNQYKLFTVFILSLVLACLIYLTLGLIYLYKGIPADSAFFIGISVLHYDHTYVACYLVLGITFLLHTLSVNQHLGSIQIIKIIFLFVLLIITLTKVAFIGMSLVLSYFTLSYLTEKTSRYSMRTSLVAFVLLVGLFLVTKFVNIPSNAFINDASERFNLWSAAWQANPNPLLGVGIGDYETTLQQYYLNNDLILFFQKHYNAHNLFLQNWLSMGVLGLCSTILVIIRPLYLVTKTRNKLGIMMLFPFVIYSVTEVIFGRYQGLVLWVILHQLYTSYALDQMKQKRYSMPSRLKLR